MVLLGTTKRENRNREKLKEMGFSSEIISSDSVQIYKKLDIGSAFSEHFKKNTAPFG